MGLRSSGKLLLFCIVFACFSLLLLQNRTGDDGVVVNHYSRRLEELQTRLQNTEHQNEARAVELYHLQQQVVRVQEMQRNASSELDTSAGWRYQQLVRYNNSDSKSLHLPSVLHYMPHVAAKEGSLRPAFHLTQNVSGVSVVIGIPTIKRDIESYLMDTLKSLVEGLSQEEKMDCLIVVFIAETDVEYVKTEAKKIRERFSTEIDSGLIDIISPPDSYYPDLNNLRETFGDPAERVKWRTKQNLDFSFLMMYARVRGLYYVQLEDDIVAVPGYLTTMKNFAMQQHSKDWLLLEFSQLGFIGKLFKASDLNLVVEFFLMFHKEKPIDWLLDHILYVKVCNPEKDSKHCSRQKAAYRLRYKPSLFQHIGLHSSLKGKVQKLKDRDFRKGGMKLSQHLNPNAEVSSTIHHYMKYTLMKAYRGEDIFWGTTPKAGDYIRFHFVPAIVVQEFRFISSNSENPGDKFYDTIVEVLPSYHKEKKDGVLEMKDQDVAKFNTTEDGFIQVGTFDDGKCIEKIDEHIGEVQELRLRVLAESKAWVILSDVLLYGTRLHHDICHSSPLFTLFQPPRGDLCPRGHRHLFYTNYCPVVS